MTEVERRAVEEAAIRPEPARCRIVHESVAAAIGTGIDITKPVGNMIVDIGGGTTDIAGDFSWRTSRPYTICCARARNFV